MDAFIANLRAWAEHAKLELGEDYTKFVNWVEGKHNPNRVPPPPTAAPPATPPEPPAAS